jgi:D-beta-D-heptose 7-phosphate kinase/D-beta-D-heptose 1-phosphate adenosyltransferase
MSADLIEVVEKLGQPQVLVVGDVMLDRYVWGDAERISQEAPVILLHADKREERLGGASNVATMLSVLGARVALAGVVGNDSDGSRIRQMLLDRDIEHECILTDPGRPSTVKERYMGRAQQKHPQQMLRVDYEVREPLSATLEHKLMEALESQIRRADIVLISDYDKGVCTPILTQHVIAASRQFGKRILVDPIRCQTNEEPHTYRKYQNCSAIKLNRLEAGLAAGRVVKSSEDAMDAGRFLLDTFGLEAAVVSLDKDGMVLVHGDGRRQVFPTRQRQVYDITGAGDMVLSIMGMALAAGADFEQAVRLANVAGGLEVEKIGVVPITWEEILADLQVSERPTQSAPAHAAKVVSRRALLQELENCRRAGRRIAFTNGCFDILHAGHVQYLQEARAQADVLVVGLNSDDSVSRLKGPHRPINPEAARADVLAGLSAVDYIALFDELTPLDLVTAVRPDVLVKGADYRKEQVVGAEFVESYGGRVHLAALKAGYSTTNLAQKMVA